MTKDIPNAPAGVRIRELRQADIPAAQAVMMRSVTEDFEESYNPVIHADIDDLNGWYVEPQGPFMLVAEDTATGEVIATCGIRAGALKEGLSPQHLVERYRDGRTGQLVRVYVLKEHRRRHIAGALVAAVLERTRAEGYYDTVALHTYPHSPGALAFWQSLGCDLVLDDVNGMTRAVFFELPLHRQPA
ncbi:MAG: GNAT family N-acetyltransferase [Kribbellaceae bacterium]|nr:GNAT family N-acetyltransferase [Catenulispora sp.]NUR94734.1 GNAT family N-acetyltransferase [Kribbellaceae bacterium]